MIYDESRSINPHAVIQNCPCGCCMSFYNLPYTNQTVASDPTSSWQVRLKGYVYKALVPRTAYFGDHVEFCRIGGEINKKPAWNALFAAIQVFLYLQYIHIFHILLTHIRLVP